jgi:ribosomal protein S18 acetylase RimI-like enzyme
MRDGDKLVGAAVFGKSFTEGCPDDGEISAIYLLHDYIGKGYGHELFTRAEAELGAKGYASLVLDVFSGNARAISFYQRHGYSAAAETIIKLGGQEYPVTVLRKHIV